MPGLTCITTTYNEGPALLSSVHSILAQSFGDFQYIIVDDGSSPETIAVLDGLRDPRLLVIRQANGGLSTARNTALDHATGDYICFLDADDLRPNWSFASIMQAIERTSADLLLCPGVLHDRRDGITDFFDAAVFDRLALSHPSGHASRDAQDYWKICTLAQQMEPQSANKVIRRAFLRRSGIRFPDTYFFEDIYFHTQVIVAADSIAILDCPAFTYFRRYERPQITATAGDLRFDILAVSKLTLEAFARRPEFHEAAQRAAVFASCLKSIEWCENSISHLHRQAYRSCAIGLMRVIDPLYTHLPPNLPPEVGDLNPTRRYLATLNSAA